MRRERNLSFPNSGPNFAKVHKCLLLTLVRHEFGRNNCFCGATHLQKHFPLLMHKTGFISAFSYFPLKYCIPHPITPQERRHHVGKGNIMLPCRTWLGYLQPPEDSQDFLVWGQIIKGSLWKPMHIPNPSPLPQVTVGNLCCCKVVKGLGLECV